MPKPHPLIEAYFKLRQQAEGLKEFSGHFEGLRWIISPGEVMRKSSDGWELRVYKIEGDIEACVTDPNGTSWTFS